MPNELVWYATVAAIATAYYGWSYRHWLLGLLAPVAPPAPSLEGDWVKSWMPVLLDLKDVLEAKGMNEGETLVRELMWRMLGGAPHDIKADTRK